MVVEATLRDMMNVTTTGNDHINIETLKAGEDTISKTLAKLYTKCLSERRIPRAWKNAKTVIIFKKGNKKYQNNYRLMCILSNIYKVLTKILTKGEETRRKPATRESWIQKQILNDRPHPRRKPTEEEVLLIQSYYYFTGVS